jgi:hypothetical protein
MLSGSIAMGVYVVPRATRDFNFVIELKLKDISKGHPKVPITSDQYLYEISEIKANLTSQLTNIIKESAFDCYIYSNGKCVNLLYM